MSGILLGMFNGVQTSEIQVVTVGQFVDCDKYGCYDVGWGYDSLVYGAGSIADGTFNAKSGATITGLYYLTGAFSTVQGLYFALGSVVTNSGWTSVTIGGVEHTRASATFTTGASSSQWYWPVTVNDFGTTNGAIVTANFV